MPLKRVLRNASVGISLLVAALLLACGDSGTPGKEPPAAEKLLRVPPTMLCEPVRSSPKMLPSSL